MKKADTPRTVQQPVNAQELAPQDNEKINKSSSRLFDVALKVYEIFGQKNSRLRK